jgi:hypothetical protein
MEGRGVTPQNVGGTLFNPPIFRRVGVSQKKKSLLES